MRPRCSGEQSIVAIQEGHPVGTGASDPQINDVSMKRILTDVLACNPAFPGHAIPERLQPAHDLLTRQAIRENLHQCGDGEEYVLCWETVCPAYVGSECPSLPPLAPPVFNQ
jgi:hypothetical protein